MGYSTVDDLKKLIDERDLVALTDDDGNETIDEPKIDEAIDIADREIDVYCSGSYDVPFQNTPEIIKNISAQMAVHNLYARRLKECPEIWQEKYKNCLKLLKMIQDGKINLLNTANSSKKVQYTTKTRYFTLETMKEY